LSLSVRVRQLSLFLCGGGGILQAAFTHLLFQGAEAMSLTVEAVYENGVLKPKEPLPFKEHEEVQITVQSCNSKLADSYGIIGWKGTHEELEQLLAEAEKSEDVP
jgi:predicted DNA-binding antitoxin AbrB/MazE fold protein